MVRDGFQSEGMSLSPLKAEPKTGSLMPGRRPPGTPIRIKRKSGLFADPNGDSVS